jgi:choline dehydrogenase
MPAGVGQLIARRNPHNWGFQTTPQTLLEGRSLYWPRGRGWGGSSTINGMIYVRGHARDYDDWADLGLTGWGYADVLPYFRRAQTLETGADDYHGGDGPLYVSWGKSRSPLYQTLIEAAVEAGHGRCEDFNGADQEGFGHYQLTVKDGERWSAASAYLRPVLGRANLAVRSHAHTTRLLIEEGRCVGVEYAHDPKAPKVQVRTRGEVHLCAGAVQSPQILMVSGIGPGEHLQAHGVPVVRDSREVGRNLQDHLDILLLQECVEPITAYSLNKGWRQYATALQWLLRREGLGRENFLESGGFSKSRPDLDRPDLQFNFVNALLVDHARGKQDRDGFSLHVCQLRPASRGTITLAGPDPFSAPLIDPNYLSAEEDRVALREGFRQARAIFAAAPFDRFRGPEFKPGAGVTTDDEIDAYVRANGETIYHPVGTCRMGVDDASVVDAQCRVRGVPGLRVVDASVMPTLVGGNTHAPTVMIAEKIADAIRGRAVLPATAVIASRHAVTTP